MVQGCVMVAPDQPQADARHAAEVQTRRGLEESGRRARRRGGRQRVAAAARRGDALPRRRRLRVGAARVRRGPWRLPRQELRPRARGVCVAAAGPPPTIATSHSTSSIIRSCVRRVWRSGRRDSVRALVVLHTANSKARRLGGRRRLAWIGRAMAWRGAGARAWIVFGWGCCAAADTCSEGLFGLR